MDESKLKGIVTTADAATFFRDYAEDLMLIEGIELRVKDAIHTLYAGDGAGLDAAVLTVTDRFADIRKKIPAAIRVFLVKTNFPATQVLDHDAVAEAEKRLGLPEPTGKFENLALNELIEVLLRHGQAPRLSQSQDVSEIRGLLQQVRDARNKLAHFRGDLTSEERRTIRFAAEWLENNLPAPSPELPSPQSSPADTPPFLDQTEAMEEETEGPQGSYGPLASHLEGTPSNITSLSPTFQQIEDILKKDLPRSAWEYRAWWSNDPMKPQSAAWLDEGWRATSVNMTDRKLTFVRTNERQEAYIRFFAKLTSRQATVNGFPLRVGSPHGQSWHILASLDKLHPNSVSIAASFTRRKHLRVEVYLDLGDRDENKRLFDRLFEHKSEFEKTIGEPME